MNKNKKDKNKSWWFNTRNKKNYKKVKTQRYYLVAVANVTVLTFFFSHPQFFAFIINDITTDTLKKTKNILFIVNENC